jgi:hypothetical protein
MRYGIVAISETEHVARNNPEEIVNAEVFATFLCRADAAAVRALHLSHAARDLYNRTRLGPLSQHAIPGLRRKVAPAPAPCCYWQSRSCAQFRVTRSSVEIGCVVGRKEGRKESGCGGPLDEVSDSQFSKQSWGPLRQKLDASACLLQRSWRT